jgi:hypothetical protein
MATYEVTLFRTLVLRRDRSATVTVEAENKEAALEKGETLMAEETALMQNTDSLGTRLVGPRKHRRRRR